MFSGYSSISQHLEKFAQRPTNANTHKSSRDMTLRYRYGMSTERLERSALLILYPSNSRGPSDPLVNEPWGMFSYSSARLSTSLWERDNESQTDAWKTQTHCYLHPANVPDQILRAIENLNCFTNGFFFSFPPLLKLIDVIYLEVTINSSLRCNKTVENRFNRYFI